MNKDLFIDLVKAIEKQNKLDNEFSDMFEKSFFTSSYLHYETPLVNDIINTISDFISRSNSGWTKKEAKDFMDWYFFEFDRDPLVTMNDGRKIIVDSPESLWEVFFD